MKKKTEKKKKKRLPYGKVNVKLFEQIKEKILAEPEHFDMKDWGGDISGIVQKCGTVCCIGGWANALTWLKDHKSLKGCCLIYLKDYDHLNLGCHCDKVFFVDDWPRKFQDIYHKAESDQEKAQIAAEYIDWICGK